MWRAASRSARVRASVCSTAAACSSLRSPSASCTRAAYSSADGSGVLGEPAGALLGGGLVGDGSLGPGGVLARGLLGFVPGAGRVLRGLGLGERGLLGRFAVGHDRDDALGELAGVALGGLATRGLGVGQRDVLAGRALGGLPGAQLALGQRLGHRPLLHVLGRRPFGFLAGFVSLGGSQRVVPREAVGLGARLDGFAGNLLRDEAFGGLLGGGKLCIAAQLDGLLGGAVVVRGSRSHV